MRVHSVRRQTHMKPKHYNVPDLALVLTMIASIVPVLTSIGALRRLTLNC